MKKLNVLLLAAAITMVLVNDLKAQSMAAGPEAGIQFFARSGSEFWGRVGGTFQYDFDQTHSAKANIEFAIGDFNMLLIVPQYRYALNQTYDGLYVGGLIKLGFILESAFGGSYIGFAPQVGYEIPISETFILDINGSLGYSSFSTKFDSPFGSFKVSVGGIDIGAGVAAKFLF